MRPRVGAAGQHRNVLARMVRAGEGGIVAVISGDDQQIVRPEPRQQVGQAAVERFEAGRVTCYVAAVPELTVEIDKISNRESVGRQSVERGEKQIEIGVVARPLTLLAGVSVREDVADLADADDGTSGLGGALEQVPRWRLHSEILAVGSPPERRSRFAGEGPRDHPADVQRIAKAAGDPADVIEALQAEGLLVRGDLEDGIGGRVTDRLAGSDMLFAERGDDCGTGIVTVTEDARQGRLPDQG